MNDLVETLSRLFEVGGVVVVTAMLFLVWQRLNTLTDRLIDILEKLDGGSTNSAAGSLDNS